MQSLTTVVVAPGPTCDVPSEAEAGVERANIRVLLKLRPLNERELATRDAASCIEVGGTSTILLRGDGESRPFAFDGVLTGAAAAGDVYDQAVGCLMPKFVAARNCTLFCYGQTGAGKTYCVEQQILPRFGQDLFARIASASGGRRWSLTASYVEIYMEALRDLLTGSAADSAVGTGAGTPVMVTIRESPTAGVYVDGCVHRPCSDAAALMAVVGDGTARRTRGETAMNAVSSRSHAVLTLHLRELDDGDDDHAVRTAKFHLVDLAGSERSDVSGTRGRQLTEGAAINKSLSELGNVIAALTEAGRRHVPYRNSQLTRLLQDSLGGNAHSAMIACVTPAAASYQETLSTLRFAERVKKIVNVARENISPAALRLERLLAENAALRARVSELEAAGAGRSVAAAGSAHPAAAPGSCCVIS